MRRSVTLAVTVVALVTIAPAAAAPAPGFRAAAAPAAGYRPPVDAPLTDTFRPPGSEYGPGNRGVDYATAPDTAVGAAGPGVVVFAGPVGGSLHVVVLHPDGIRTTYSYLAATGVRRGDRVAAGQALGTAGASLHFGARAGDAYVDPLVLLAGDGGGPRVHLVPAGAGAHPGTEGGERRGLERMLRAAVRVGAAAAGWAAAGGPPPAVTAGAVRAWLEAAGPAAGPLWLHLAAVAAAWQRCAPPCTPLATAPPAPAGRRLAVLVAGLGSRSDAAAVDQVDTAALGYAPADVVRFSYRGGTTADRPYAGPDTEVHIARSGARLRALLERFHREHPGVPVDVIAHSQGGLVARAALAGPGPARAANVITLGSPHRGADLATAADRVGRTPTGAVAEALAGRVRAGGLDPAAVSVREMAETSAFIRRLNARSLPAGVRLTSIAARGDVVVASPRSRVAGATNVVVTVAGVNQHAALPGSPEARREMALALAGMAPTCEGLVDVVTDAVVGEAVAAAEDLGGVALAAVG